MRRWVSLDGRIASVVSRLDGRIGSVESRLEAKIDHVAAVAKSDLEAALWRHTVTIILALVAVAGVSIAIVRALK